jgi:hypothetical protein
LKGKKQARKLTKESDLMKTERDVGAFILPFISFPRCLLVISSSPIQLFEDD